VFPRDDSSCSPELFLYSCKQLRRKRIVGQDLTVEVRRWRTPQRAM